MRHPTFHLALAAFLAGAVACADRSAEETGAADETAATDPTLEEAAPDETTGTTELIVVQGSEIEWGDGPPSLPTGATMAVIEGNPTEEGPFTLRLRAPAGYEIPPHRHHAVEHVTVIDGSISLGTGETVDRSTGRALSPGDFFAVPVGDPHYVWVGDEGAEIQVHAIGPWVIEYVNPADDPRNATAPASASSN